MFNSSWSTGEDGHMYRLITQSGEHSDRIRICRGFSASLPDLFLCLQNGTMIILLTLEGYCEN